MKKLNREIFKNQRFLIVFDLDGTLLNSNKTIEPKTAALIQELDRLGNVITMASGRPRRSIQPYFEQLDLHAPFVGYNGTLIINPSNSGFKEMRRLLPKELIYDLLNHFGEDSFKNIMAEDEEDQYYLHENHLYESFFHPVSSRLHIGSILKNINRDMMSLVLESHDTSRNKEIEDYLEEKYDDVSIRFWYDAPTFGELFYYSVNKSTAITQISQFYNIDRSHIIVFGDAMNDAEMISKAGISFAMKNAAPPLKEMATYTTEFDNDHEGIYYALLEMFGVDE